MVDYSKEEVKAIEALYTLFCVEIRSRKELEDWKENYLNMVV